MTKFLAQRQCWLLLFGASCSRLLRLASNRTVRCTKQVLSLRQCNEKHGALRSVVRSVKAAAHRLAAAGVSCLMRDASAASARRSRSRSRGPCWSVSAASFRVAAWNASSCCALACGRHYAVISIARLLSWGRQK